MAGIAAAGLLVFLGLRLVYEAKSPALTEARLQALPSTTPAGGDARSAVSRGGGAGRC